MPDIAATDTDPIANFELARALKANRVNDLYVDFFGGWFSSFATIPFELDGTWLTREHRFQALKSLDEQTREQIRACLNPGTAKMMGREVELRDDWEDIKYTVMLNCIRAQTDQAKWLRDLLLRTGDREIREDSPTDFEWGFRSADKKDQGKNLLGKAWMEAREELK